MILASLVKFLSSAASLFGLKKFGLGWPLDRYHEWVSRYGTISAKDCARIRLQLASIRSWPKFHIFISAPDARDSAGLEATIGSLSNQLYRDFSFRILDGGADDVRLLASIPVDDWLIFLNAGDRLTVHALYEFACVILAGHHANIIYCDDDVIDANGRYAAPRLKPDWSISHVRSTDYMGNAMALRNGAVAAAGGIAFSSGKPELYEMTLRVAELAEGEIVHIPFVLLHRASFAGAAETNESPADAHNMEIVRAHLARCGITAQVMWTHPGCWRVKYGLPDKSPMVSIIVPTRDASELIRQCVESLRTRTDYAHYEILVVDNQSKDPAALHYLDEMAKYPGVRILRYDQPFNYSAINNYAVSEALGQIVCLLNNDTEIISLDWLDEMIGNLLQNKVGVVGAKLYYPDGRVQHGGDVVGVGGTANHLHAFLKRGEPGYCNRAIVTQELSAVTAACLLTWKGLYVSLGGLDEKNLPVAFNDVDYCLRVRELGYKVVWTPHAELIHHESVSRRKNKTVMRRMQAKREVSYMRARWRESLNNDPFYNPNFSRANPDFMLGVAKRMKLICDVVD